MSSETHRMPATAMAMRKAVLEKTREELLRRSPREREAIRIEAGSDPSDNVISGTEIDIAVQRLDAGTRLSHDIDLALSKMQDNTYGICERCERPISPKRLDAVPWARLCITCQAEAEAAEHKQFPLIDYAA